MQGVRSLPVPSQRWPSEECTEIQALTFVSQRLYDTKNLNNPTIPHIHRGWQPGKLSSLLEIKFTQYLLIPQTSTLL